MGQEFLDVKINLIDPNCQRLGKFKSKKLKKWLVGHGLNDDGSRQELIRRIENFQEHPQLKEPEFASDEIFNFPIIEANIKRAQNRISGIHQIKLVEVEPTALNINKIQDGFVVDEDIFNFLNRLIMEIEVREECKGMKKKELQDWLVKESGCRSNNWLKVNNQELSNRICRHFLKNKQISQAETKKLHKKKEKEKSIITEYQMIFLSALIHDGFPGLIAQVFHLSSNVQITTTKEEYLVCQSFGEQKKFVYKMRKLPYVVRVGDKRAKFLLVFENFMIFGNSPLDEESRFQIHFVYSAEAEDDVEIITGKPFEVMHIFYTTNEEHGFPNKYQARFKKLSEGEVSVIEYFENNNI